MKVKPHTKLGGNCRPEQLFNFLLGGRNIMIASSLNDATKGQPSNVLFGFNGAATAFSKSGPPISPLHSPWPVRQRRIGAMWRGSGTWQHLRLGTTLSQEWPATSGWGEVSTSLDTWPSTKLSVTCWCDWQARREGLFKNQSLWFPSSLRPF